jgi:glycine cleavage system H lipoate-binding protein
MMNVPENLRYSKDHEWVRLDGNKATVGITDFAQKEMGDVVFVEAPEVGKTVGEHTVCQLSNQLRRYQMFMPLLPERLSKLTKP